MEEFHDLCPAFDEDIYEAVSLKTCIDKRLTTGAPGAGAMEQEIANAGKHLEEEGLQ